MSPLSEEERAHIRETEVLRNDIRRELDATKGSSLEKLKHEVILLILGFVLTTAVGSWLAYFWKQREWHNQQDQLAVQRALEHKYKVMEDLFMSVSTTKAAMDDVLTSYTWRGWAKEEIEERKKNWLATSRQWRIAQISLENKLVTHFGDPNIRSTFDKIARARTEGGNIITNLLTRGYESEEEAERARSTALTLSNEIRDLLRECGRQMVKETKSPVSQ